MNNHKWIKNNTLLRYTMYSDINGTINDPPLMEALLTDIKIGLERI